MPDSGQPPCDPVGALVRRAGEIESVGEGTARSELQRRLFGDAAPPAAPPVALDRYIVISRLGQGGDGVVYGAWDPELDRQVAIKVLRRRGTDAHARLLHEARTIAKLRHPNIVQIHDIGRALLVMEYVPGGDLTRWLAAAPRSWREIVRMYAAVARGLAAAHVVGVVHRDVKPTNVLIGRDGLPRVVDFGLAFGRARRTADESDGPNVAGTLPYMAPEQHRGEAPDGRADQYALGVSLYEGLARRRPFIGNASVLLRTKEQAAFARLEKVPRRLAATIARMLAPNPEGRFVDMNAVAAALEASVRPDRTALWCVAAASVAAIVTVRLLAPDPCAVPDHSPAATWSQRERADDPSALEASAVARVDAIAGGWSDAWHEVCEPSRVHDEVSVAVQTAQTRCLDRHAVAFAAADAELQRHASTLDVGAHGRTIAAVALAAAIEPVEHCDVDAIAAMEPHAAGAWGPAAAWEHLARARVLHELGREVDALAVLRGGWNALREQHGDAPLVRARLYLASARAHAGLGEFERAKHELFESLWQAEPVRDHATAAAAWLELAWIEGVERSGPASERWLAFAAAAVARAGDDAWSTAELDHLRGGMHYRAGRFDAAIAAYRRAHAAQRALVGNDHPWTARTSNHLGNALFEGGRIDDAIVASTIALATRRQTLAPDHPLIAAALNNLAGMHLAHGDRDAADALAEESLALLAGQGGPHELFAQVVHARIEEARGDEAAALEGYRAALGVRMASIERSHPAALAAREALAARQVNRDPP